MTNVTHINFKIFPRKSILTSLRYFTVVRKNKEEQTCPGRNDMSIQWPIEKVLTIETMKYQNHKKRKIFSLNMLIIKTHCTVWWWTFPKTRTWKKYWQNTNQLNKRENEKKGFHR